MLNHSWNRIQRLTFRGLGFPATSAFEVGIPPCNGTTGGLSSTARDGGGRSSRRSEVPFSGSSTKVGEDMISSAGGEAKAKAIGL